MQCFNAAVAKFYFGVGIRVCVYGFLVFLFLARNLFFKRLFTLNLFLNFGKFFFQAVNFFLKCICIFLSGGRGLLQGGARKQIGDGFQKGFPGRFHGAVLLACFLRRKLGFFVRVLVFLFGVLHIRLRGGVLGQRGKDRMVNGAADRAGFSFLQIAGHHSGLLPEKRCILVIVNLQKAAGGGQRSLESLLQFVELFLLSVEVFHFGKQLCEFLFAIACVA